MPSDVRLYDETFAELTTAPDWVKVPGQMTDPVRFFVINDYADGSGADTAFDRAIVPQERVQGATEWQGSGLPMVDGRRVVVRVIDGYGGLEIAPTGWEPTGDGRPFRLPPLPSGQGVELEVALDVPPGDPPTSTEIYVGVGRVRNTPLAQGLTEAAGNGVYTGLGDGESSALVTLGQITESSPTGPSVEVVGPWGWIFGGEPWSDHGQALTLDDTAADGTLSAGEAYWVLVHTQGASGLVITKGNKGADPLAQTERPGIPAGADPVAYIYRDSSGVISDADIEIVATLGLGLLSHSGLSAQLAPSSSLVANRWVEHQAPEQVTLGASATYHLWRLPVGETAITTDGSSPAPGSDLLYEIETDVSGVASTTRRAHWLGRDGALTWQLDGPLTGTRESVLRLPPGEPSRILPLVGEVSTVLLDLGSPASGSTEIDIETADPSSYPLAWSSILASPLSIPWDTATGQASAIPQALTLPAGHLIRCRLAGEVDATHPAGAVITVRLFGHGVSSAGHSAPSIGAGDVTGPASAADGQVMVSDGTTGKVLKTAPVAVYELSGSGYIYRQGGASINFGYDSTTQIQARSDSLAFKADGSTVLRLESAVPTSSNDPNSSGEPVLVIKDGALYWWSVADGKWRSVTGAPFGGGT